MSIPTRYLYFAALPLVRATAYIPGSLAARGLLLFLTLFTTISSPVYSFGITEPAGASSPDHGEEADDAAICDGVTAQVALETNIPATVLQAITRTETGRQRAGEVRPWPWTVNMEGTGKWFNNQAEALAYVQTHFSRGARSFDIGCFQINFRWHGQHFESISAMFDPLENARYAAKFLGELYRETGTWDDAAGAYHSRTPEFARRYKARFRRFRSALENKPPVSEPLAEIIAAPLAPEQQQQEHRINLFPLLRATGNSRSHGSLVSLAAPGNGRSILQASD